MKRCFILPIPLYIVNAGGPVSNFQYKVRTFITVEFYYLPERGLEKVPVVGFYSSGYKTDKPSGEMAVIKDYLNNSKFFEIHWETMSEEFKKEHGSIDINLMHAIKVSYVDRLGDVGESYFIGENLSTKENVEELFKEWNSMHISELGDLDGKRLMEKIKARENVLGPSNN